MIEANIIDIRPIISVFNTTYSKVLKSSSTASIYLIGLSTNIQTGVKKEIFLVKSVNFYTFILKTNLVIYLFYSKTVNVRIEHCMKDIFI